MSPMPWDKTSDKYKTLNHELSMKSHFFLNKMLNKIHEKVDEDGRSMEPWKDYEPEFLAQRLKQEIGELEKELIYDPVNDHYSWGYINYEKTQAELIDVANFCFFLFYSLEETDREEEE